MTPSASCRWCRCDYPVYGNLGTQYHILANGTDQERQVECEENSITPIPHASDCPCADCAGDQWKGT